MKSNSLSQQATAKKQKTEIAKSKEKQVDIKKSEINDIFNAIKTRRKTDTTISDTKSKDEKKQKSKEKEKIEIDKSNSNDDDGFSDSRGIRSNRKRTEDGLFVYSAEELSLGKGGDSPDCPFDCQCCF